jgi:predicted methyltransferase MtxX (methanogen marker protein 4)
MARDIDDAEVLPAGKIEIRESEFNGDAATLLFLEPVGIDSGNRLDQRGLSMVDVSGSSEDYLLQF